MSWPNSSTIADLRDFVSDAHRAGSITQEKSVIRLGTEEQNMNAALGDDEWGDKRRDLCLYLAQSLRDNPVRDW